MKLYLATTTQNLEIAKRAIEVIRSQGHDVIYDWTIGIPDEKNMNAAGLAGLALADVAAIQASDGLIVLMQKKMERKMIGCAIEIGVALGAGVPVVVALEGSRFENFFENHPLLRVRSSLAGAIFELEPPDER